jgi:hypothetical protein
MSSVTPGSVTPTPLEKLLNALEASYRARIHSVPLVGRANYVELFSPVENEVLVFLQNIATNPSAGKPSEIVERIRKRRSALDLRSDITTEVVGICKQVLAFGAAGLGLTVGFADKIKLLAPALQKGIVIAGVVYLELVLVSLLVLFWYLLQARFRYPFLHFRDIGNTWPWFYYASISAGVSRWPVQFPRQLFRSGVLYAEDLVRFADRALSETETEELRVELQQYFLLLSYQGYVNQFSLRLTNMFFYGFAGALVSGLVLCIWAVAR